MDIKEIRAIEEQFSLPQLSGSEKQVAWARDIRATHLQKTEQESGKGFGCFHSFFSSEEEKDAFQRILTCAREHITARWWIDNRFREDYDCFTYRAVAPLADISRKNIVPRSVKRIMKKSRRMQSSVKRRTRQKKDMRGKPFSVYINITLLTERGIL